MSGAQKLKLILEYLDINANELAIEMKLKRPQALYDILNGKAASISGKMASKIHSHYPQISLTWLLDGKGEMVSHGTQMEGIVLYGKSPFPEKPSKEWAVIELLVQEIAVDRSRTSNRSVVDCLKELYAKIDLVLNGGRQA